MFGRKKELTFEEELAITVRHLQNWVEFIETEIKWELDDETEIADLGDMTVAEARDMAGFFRGTIAFLEPLQ